MSHSHHPDYILMFIFAILAVFGLVMLSSASVALSYQKWNDNYYLLKHQILFGLLPGLFLFFFAYKIDYRKWEKPAFIILIAIILLLASVFIPGLGAGIGNAKSWISIWKITFQPSEFIKLALILFLSAWLGKKGKEIQNLEQGLIPFLGVLGLISFLILKQPDLGTASIVIFISCFLYFIGHTPKRDFLILILLGVVMLLLLIKVAPPHQIARFKTFFNPSADPQGQGYQTNQAFLAIGSGGIFGRGLGLSIQKFQYLPEPAGDSIFAVIAEELGFLSSFILVTIFLILGYRGYKIAKRCGDDFGKFVALGISFMFIIQSFINIGGMVGLIPLTGVPLPFISYGGSAMITSLISAGILLNISKYA